MNPIDFKNFHNMYKMRHVFRLNPFLMSLAETFDMANFRRIVYPGVSDQSIIIETMKLAALYRGDSFMFATLEAIRNYE